MKIAKYVVASMMAAAVAGLGTQVAHAEPLKPLNDKTFKGCEKKAQLMPHSLKLVCKKNIVVVTDIVWDTWGTDAYGQGELSKFTVDGTTVPKVQVILHGGKPNGGHYNMVSLIWDDMYSPHIENFQVQPMPEPPTKG